MVKTGTPADASARAETAAATSSSPSPEEAARATGATGGAGDAAAPAVAVVGLRRSYGAVRAVDGVSLKVQAGELVSLLGPSGCGKTTTLRAIAGFERPDAGDVFLGGARVTERPPNQRDIGMVFQGYALFPHMTVFENVAFGLQMRKRGKREIAEAVARALQLVRLSGFEHRLPKQLSGGQQQRVAIARALAIQPTVLLLDEPLSNLDAKLREEMRVELKRLLKPTGIATIFVTHDQEEAMVLSDRIVVMNGGVVEQVGSPREIYERPRTRFVATFIGRANLFEGTVESVGPPRAAEAAGGAGGASEDRRAVVVATPHLRLRGVAAEGLAGDGLIVGSRATVAVRQERVRVSAAGAMSGADASERENRVDAHVELVNYLGGNVQTVCTCAGGQQITALGAVTATAPVAGGERGTPVTLAWSAAETLVFPEGRDPGASTVSARHDAAAARVDDATRR